jgi:hypothetical protein
MSKKKRNNKTTLPKPKFKWKGAKGPYKKLTVTKDTDDTDKKNIH